MNFSASPYRLKDFVSYYLFDIFYLDIEKAKEYQQRIIKQYSFCKKTFEQYDTKKSV